MSGFIPGVHATPIIRKFAGRTLSPAIDVFYTSVTDQLDFLIGGRGDVCFVRLPVGGDTFTTLPLFSEPQAVAALVPTRLHSCRQLRSTRSPACRSSRTAARWRGGIARWLTFSRQRARACGTA